MERPKPNFTRWTLILRAQGTGPDARAALGDLIEQYEGFILWLIRSHPPPPDVNPEDLKQSFLVEVLKRNDIARLDRERGSFRSWLKTAVRRFMFNEWDSWRTETHGRRVTAVLTFDPYHVSTPEDDVCNRAFACHLVRRVLSVMRTEAPDLRRFEQIERFLPGPQMDLVAQGPVARSLGMQPTALAKTICQKRDRFKELLRECVRDTLVLDASAPPEAWARAEEAELCELRRCFHEFERAGLVLEDA
jgi:DNA-directed RNA polymerase specialized sigma24 family protein